MNLPKKFKIIASPKSMQVMNVALTVAAVIGVLSTAWFYYKNKIWRPTVIIKKVDWTIGYASLLIENKTKDLYAGSQTSAGGDWAIRFANSPDGDNLPDRIELVKNNIVYKNLLIRGNE